MLNMNFYDIESLRNVFTLANYKEPENIIELFVLYDDVDWMKIPNIHQLICDAIYKENHNFSGSVVLYDLKTEFGCKHLAETFGLSDAYLVNDPESESNYPDAFRIVCDTDPEYIANPDKYPYFAGYNSINYDTTMLTLFFHEVFVVPSKNAADKRANKDRVYFKPTTATMMRDYNDDLFTSRFKDAMPSYLTMTKTQGIYGRPNYSDSRWKIRKNMLMTGRQIDISQLNEKQRKVGLKRLLGMEGYQIKESDKLDSTKNVIYNLEEFLDLIAYNISDIVNLAELFTGKLYQAQFTLKRQLLYTYPELVYEQLSNGEYAPDVRPEKVRRDRLYIDSTSSQFAQKTLCPYGHLKDIPAVSYLYPHPDKAKELGIPVVNVLEEAKKFFYGLYPQPELRAKFDNVYNYYKSIEGKNFNESQNYIEDFGDMAIPVTRMSEIEKTANCIPYFDKDGNPTSGFVTFSVGGVHGAEYNQELFEADYAAWERVKADFDYVKSVYPDPVAFREICGKKPKEITLPNGEVWKSVIFNRAAKNLLALSDDERHELMTTPDLVKGKVKQNMKILLNLYPNLDEIQEILDKPIGVIMPDGRLLPVSHFLASGRKVEDSAYKNVDDMEPKLFKTTDDGALKLNADYVYTSSAKANHEDFTSYYPNLLRMMKAFFNAGLGYDRYAEIFQQKQDYGAYMKDKNRPQEERDLYTVLREGTKLILNSASGAGDATFDNNIRVNNSIISMRIIGQLFSWRIGQAQSYYGAKVISTNTDGLYSVMEEELNNEILARESANIGVEIEPEPLYLISKDTNNRIELKCDTMEIIGASGGTLGCRKGPKPDKSLAHPAIIDWALSEYLTIASQGYKGLSLDKPFNDTIGMSILKSAIKKHDPVTWLRMFQNVIASSPGSVRYIYGITDEEPNEPIILQHYNRVFYMKENTENTIHLWAAFARVVTDATKTRRKKDGIRDILINPIALHVLQANGVTSPPAGKDITSVKIPGIADDWCIFVQNKDLRDLTMDEYDFILENLNYDNYLTLLRDGFEKNWRNKLPNRHYIQFMNLGECIATETVMNDQTVDSIPKPMVADPANLKEWNTMPDGSGEILTDNMLLSENMTVYSVYQ